MTRDPLTGLRTARDLAGEEGSVVAIWIDIDHVKRLCDRDGHLAGDGAIATIARVIREVAGDGGTYRTGGDEFLVLMPGGVRDAGAELAERIRSAVAAAAVLTISAGVACGADVGEAWVRAEACVMSAKQAGRNAVSVD